MKTYNLLNLIILTLSISTIIVTFLSFLIFKIRKMQLSDEVKSEFNEGTYFKKYSTDKKEPEALRLQENQKKYRFVRFRSMPFFFILISLTIFLSLLFQNNIEKWNFFSKFSSDEIKKTFYFLSGVVYKLNGSIQKIAKNVFVLAPNNIDIISDNEDGLYSKDIINWEFDD